MTCLGVLNRGEQDDDNETSLKEGGRIEMSTTVLPFACNDMFELISSGAYGKYSKRRRACIAYMESTVVDISILPPSFKPVSLSLSRISFILKHPNKSFFNPINIFEHLLHTLLLFYNLQDL